ncbi:hypothetical protein RIU14_01985 [Riemerella anatipestifer]|uniref:hypothetical protein n=1 Tax=Riemerella anatipestifer TaxID=34085 RepID=UPI002866AF47|nr:hypothetical protein [Riemerella anatipestifer]MDR7693544.1 hypothetical protein [Riemerella anatipestifer]MDR7793684.1 hypothetical protein [Riemerella anatipestifer]
MKQKLTILGLSGLLLLTGCRADDMVTNAKRQDNWAKKFSVFTKKTDNEVIDYAKGFEILAQIHDSLYHTNISGRKHIEKLLELSKVKDIDMSAIEAKPYVDFGIHSQTITEKNGDKWVVFPRIQDGMVKDLVCGVLSDEETQVHYYVLKRDTEFYKNSIGLFQNAYIEKYAPAKKALNSSQKFLELGICTKKGNFFDNCNIPIVILPPPPPKGGGNGSSSGGGGGGSSWDWFGWDRPIDRGCMKYYKCNDPDNGGGGYSHPIPPRNPCKKMKGKFEDPIFKKNFERLQKKETLDLDHELGFAESYEKSTPTLLTNRTGTTSVRLPEDGRSYYGFMHTHNNKEGVVRIFSPADVATFLSSCVRNAEEKENASDAYAIVVTSEGSYTLKYTGDGNYSLGPNQLSQWDTWYRKNYSNLIENDQFIQPNVERVFTQFLKEVVRIEGLEVYKSTPTSSEKMEYNGENQPVKTTPCN